MQLTRNVIANIVYEAKNFAHTNPGRVTGEVSRSCSVLSFLSSEKDFIVRSGVIRAMTISSAVKYEDTLASVPARKVNTQKTKLDIAKNIAI